MEGDRAQADLGEAVNAELDAEKQEKQRQPKKRFIGRKEAAERAEKRADTDATIEDSRALQGMQLPWKSADVVLTSCSCTIKKDCKSAQPYSSRGSQRSRNQRCHISSAPELLLRNTQDNTPYTYISI